MRFIFSLILLISISLQADEISHQKIEFAWETYYQNTLHMKKPFWTASLALQYFEMEGKYTGRAADLGAGTGRDTLFLLENGWQVLATDAEQRAIDIISSRVDEKSLSSLDLQVASFTQMILPNELDFINASYSLPFCKPEEFPQAWEIIIAHLAKDGRFAGHFFGPEDDRADDPSLTILNKEKLLQLFNQNFQIEYFQEEIGVIPTANGSMAQRHIFHVVAKKIS